jgi:hypothetical protein
MVTLRACITKRTLSSDLHMDLPHTHNPQPNHKPIDQFVTVALARINAGGEGGTGNRYVSVRTPTGDTVIRNKNA